MDSLQNTNITPSIWWGWWILALVAACVLCAFLVAPPPPGKGGDEPVPIHTTEAARSPFVPESAGTHEPYRDSLRGASFASPASVPTGEPGWTSPPPVPTSEPGWTSPPPVPTSEPGCPSPAPGEYPDALDPIFRGC